MQFLQPDLHPQSWTSRSFPFDLYVSLMDLESRPFDRNGADEKTPPDQYQSQHPLRTADANHMRSVRITWQGAAL